MYILTVCISIYIYIYIYTQYILKVFYSQNLNQNQDISRHRFDFDIGGNIIATPLHLLKYEDLKQQEFIQISQKAYRGNYKPDIEVSCCVCHPSEEDSFSCLAMYPHRKKDFFVHQISFCKWLFFLF